MKKRIFASLIALVVAITCVLVIPTYAEQVTATASGNSNVSFSNGYRGYCIDMNKHYANEGQVFETIDTSIADNNNTGNEISMFLKALFVLNFESLFVADGNGGYELDFNKKDSLLPSVIWNLSDDRYVYGEQKTLAEAAKAYEGVDIPDEGYTITLSNGDVITFYFLVMHPEDAETQDFFAYKIVVNEEPTATETTTESTTAETTTETTTESTTAETTTETTTESTTAETTTETTTESTTAETTTESDLTSGSGGEDIGGGSVIIPPIEDEEESTTDNSNETTTGNGTGGDSSNETTTGNGTSKEEGSDENTTTDSKPEGTQPDETISDGTVEDIPNTNNISSVALWMALAILSIGGITVVTSMKKKKIF